MQIKEVFFIRCISCLSVVLIHAIAILSSPQQSSIFTALLMFSTPSFIFISEFLLAHAYPDGTPKGFMWKRIKAIFFPFVFIGIIDALMYSASINWGLIDFFKRASANVFLGNYIGYFVLIIFQFYLLHMVFHKFNHLISPKWVLSISFMITIGYLSLWNFVKIPQPQLPNPMFGLEWIPFPGWLFYFCLAYYCGKHYQQFIALLYRFQFAVYGLIMVSAMNVLSNSYLGFFTLSSKRPDVVLYTVSFIFLCFLMFSKVKKVPAFVQMVSQYSFTIYLLHGYFLGIAVLLWTQLKEYPFSISTILITVLAVVGPIFISWAANHHKHGYMFVGKINRPRQKSAVS
ncbi:acyltransferase family protein [Bacillus pumilus]|uniref:acyltransferase family protein n=1 Tax=Bacillus pumilus TaxID=1408 RepID=UPI001C24F86A|nr:acyltransferase family protein [Bacillus pumilus]MBU8695207.1 acyltransferase family protein [Bacillus pumilus]